MRVASGLLKQPVEQSSMLMKHAAIEHIQNNYYVHVEKWTLILLNILLQYYCRQDRQACNN